MEKRRNCSFKSNFTSFPQYFQHNSNFKSPITYIFVKCGCSNNFFLYSANLIYRGTEISKYLIESLGIRDSESRLYFNRAVLSVLFLLLYFSVLWALHFPRLGKRELILVLLIRLFDFLLVSRKGCGLWLWHSLDFSLPFYTVHALIRTGR